jgi:hypothetical protein
VLPAGGVGVVCWHPQRIMTLSASIIINNRFMFPPFRSMNRMNLFSCRIPANKST